MKIFDGAIRFIKEVRSELKSVTWPTKDDLKEGTVVVIMMSIMVALFLAGVDLLFGFAIRSIF